MMGTTEFADESYLKSAHPPEHQFQMFADKIPELCFMASAEGEIFWRNAKWYEYTGMTPEQVKGRCWEAVHHPEVLPFVLARWKASLARGTDFEMEFPLRGADGSYRWFLSRITPVRDGNGKIVFWLGANTDIQALRTVRVSLLQICDKLDHQLHNYKAELELIASDNSRKAALLDLVNDAVFVRNANGRISYWNGGAERLYGWTSIEAVGQSTDALLRTEFPDPLEKITSRDHWEGELRHNKRDGTQVTVASRWTRLQDEQGETTGWLELNTDITARKKAEEAARTLTRRMMTLQDEERRRIARNLHDSLGQSLTALKINLDVLRAHDGNSDELLPQCLEMVDTCLSETRTISHLLHPPLLDEAGLRSALQWCAAGFSERCGIRVHLELAPELNRLHQDIENAIFRVAQEALTNIHRHSHASEVTIRLHLDAGKIRLEIRDNGDGIPEKKLQGLAESRSGTGVGLLGIRERVRDLGGTFDINSDETGTLLSIAVPASSATQQSPNQNHSTEISAST